MASNKDKIIQGLDAMKRKGLIGRESRYEPLFANINALYRIPSCVFLDPRGKEEILSIVRDNYTRYMIELFFLFLKSKNVHQKWLYNVTEVAINGGWSSYLYTSVNDFLENFHVKEWIHSAFPWDGKVGSTNGGDYILWAFISREWKVKCNTLSDKLLLSEF